MASPSDRTPRQPDRFCSQGRDHLLVSSVALPGPENCLILTVRARSPGPRGMELTFTTMGGNIAATLKWPSDAPAIDLPKAIVDAVECNGFDCPIKPLRVWHLRLIGADGSKLAFAPDSPTLAEQLGLVP